MEEIYFGRENIVAKKLKHIAEIIRLATDAFGLTCGQQVNSGMDAALFPDELEMMTYSIVKRKPRTYLEWGSGGSSSWLAVLSNQSFSIESADSWCRQVKLRPVPKCMIEQGRFRMICNAFGEDQNLTYYGGLGAINYISNPAFAVAGRSYAEKIKDFGHKLIDVVLVDGRFRMACALIALNYIDRMSVVIVHDFFARVSHYLKLLDYYDIIGRTRTVVVLKVKPKDQLPDGWETQWTEHLSAQFR